MSDLFWTCSEVLVDWFSTTFGLVSDCVWTAFRPLVDRFGTTQNCTVTNNFFGQNRPKPNFVAQIDRKRFFWPQLTETNFFGQNRLEPNFLSKKPKTVFGQNWPELTKNIIFGQNGPKSIIPAKNDPKRVNIDQTPD